MALAAALLMEVISKLGMEVFNIPSRASVLSGHGAEVALPLGGLAVLCSRGVRLGAPSVDRPW